MVLTPDHPPLDPNTPLSPLLLPQTRAHRSPSILPILPTTPSSASSIGSSTLPLQQSHPLPPPLLRKASTSSLSKLSDFQLESPALVTEPSASTSDNPLGIAHVDLSLNPGEWRHPVFKTKILSVIRKMMVPLWTHPSLTPSNIHLQKVSGALTNAVFFVSFNPSSTPTSPSISPMLTPTLPPVDPDRPPSLSSHQYPPTLLLRVYGPSSDALISRKEELRILHVLSMTYGLGPKVYGTFTNGRVEQFFPSRALTPSELRKPHIYRSIARRLRELHSVDLRLLGYESSEPMVWRCLAEWATLAEDVLTTLASSGGHWEIWVEHFGLHKVRAEIETYRQWVTEQVNKGVVFAHNDTQYGNLLCLDGELKKGSPEHHRYIVIDFEYAAPNPRGYDIANHFHEWRANYHHPTLSHSLQPHFPYPSDEERKDFYRAYLSVEMDATNGEETLSRRKDIAQEKVTELEREVRVWSPACSAFWSLWGIVQAAEQVAALLGNAQDYAPDFDYLAYALERLEMFRTEARELGAL